MLEREACCVIGLGANLGERRAAMVRAVRACGRLGRVAAVSALYETSPVGGRPQPDFLNAALLLYTRLQPEALLLGLLDIERSEGRERSEPCAPRTLDLDILWIRGVRTQDPRIEVPHPRLCTRVFALLPLLDVAPDAVDPGSGAAYDKILAGLDQSGVKLVVPDSSWAETDA